MTDRTPSEKQLQNANIPPRYWDRPFEWLEPSDATAEVEKYLNDLKTHRHEGRGLLMLGHPGRGKTHLGCALLMEAMAEGYSVMFTTISAYRHRLMRQMQLNTAWSRMGDEDAYREWLQHDEALKAMRNNIEFLMIDDVGKEYSTDSRWIEDELDFLLRHRYDRGLPTIMTTNKPLAEWKARYSDSMESFLRESCVLVGVDGPDRRKGG